MKDSECVAKFRVNKHGLPDLAEAVQISGVFTCRQRSIIDSMEGLCMPFWRLAYPCRYSYMMARFGRPAPVLSMITNEVLDFIYTNHSHRILQWNPAILQPVKLEKYANAVQIKGGALNNCFGFIDGTVRPISWPGQNQRSVYDGHKRCGVAFRRHSKPFNFIDYKKNLKSGLSIVENVSCLRHTKKCTDMSLWQHYIKVFLSGVSKIIRVLYLNVFRNISTLKISKNHISENSCLNNQNYTSVCKVK